MIAPRSAGYDRPPTGFTVTAASLLEPVSDHRGSAPAGPATDKVARFEIAFHKPPDYETGGAQPQHQHKSPEAAEIRGET
ncbi:hypothetical protein AS594_37870 [Streptomyces agglomeratus]|uniref:Uncharacterized protein n=1 Tax=Streptomyces agglomeratus TaxID=285458 RepID=A0A1E5NYK0_9ACTN|nr:hypothetical protein AS594_37870 [Streptomyces agglomeratus]